MFPSTELNELKNLITEAEEKKFPESDLLQTLINAVTEAEKCSNVANQLVSKKVRTRFVFTANFILVWIGDLTSPLLPCFLYIFILEIDSPLKANMWLS